MVSCGSADGNHARAHQWEQKEGENREERPWERVKEGSEKFAGFTKVQDEPILLYFCFHFCGFLTNSCLQVAILIPYLSLFDRN